MILTQFLSQDQHGYNGIASEGRHYAGWKPPHRDANVDDLTERVSAVNLNNNQYTQSAASSSRLPESNHYPDYPPVYNGPSGEYQNTVPEEYDHLAIAKSYPAQPPYNGRTNTPGPYGNTPQPPYDPLYAAASDVLGSGQEYSYPYQNRAHDVQYTNASSQPEYTGSYRTSLESQDTSGNTSWTPAPSDSASQILSKDGTYSTDGYAQSFSSSEPSLRRSVTSASVAPGTRKSKAVDLSAPPYTKEYVDEYRQRIKGDPDPEAHFLYAKYLIEAAKRVQSDQRNAKKYKELLVQESLKVMRRLATQGDAYAEAQFFLANCHGTGFLGLPIDHERAYHLYLQAAKQNHPAASYRVAVCNEIGAGTRREPPRAFAFYRKAASLGDTAAMYKLGMVLLKGLLGQPRNAREAIAWLQRAAEQADEENPHALYELAMLYELPPAQDLIQVIAQDFGYSKELYTRAAHLGYAQAQFKLGQCYEYGSLTCPVDPRRSIAWYTRAAEKGESEAELALSGWYLTGSEGILKQSDSEAYLWARRAANKGLSKAEYAVGYYAEVGIGVKKDMELAKRWYMRAAGMLNYWFS